MIFDAGSIVARMRLDDSSFAGGILKAQGLAQALGPTVSTFMTNPILGAVNAMKQFVGLAREQERAEQKLEAVIRATGGAAGFTAEQLKTQASALQSVTTYGDETILNAQAMLATFKNVSGEQFTDATKAILDMSTVMGTDLKSSALQLGKALNDPAQGLSALTRVGVSFTQQQMDQIKAMQAAGDVAGAQRAILAELQGQFGGAAEAVAEGGGQWEQLLNTLGDVGELIGGAVMPVFAGLAEVLQPVLELLAPLIELLGKAISVIGSPLSMLGDIVGDLQASLGLSGGDGETSVNVTVDPQRSAAETARAVAPAINRAGRGAVADSADYTRRRLSASQYERGMVLG